MKRVWKWLTAPGEGNAWAVLAIAFTVGGVVSLFIVESAFALACFAYSLAAQVTARVTFLESISHDQSTFIVKLLQKEVENQRDKAETN